METNHEYAKRVARGCARGIALGDVDEFKRVLQSSFQFEINGMTAPTRRQLREAFEEFTPNDIAELFAGSAYRP